MSFHQKFFLKNIFSFIPLIVLISTGVFADDSKAGIFYFVSPQGRDTWSGTLADPKADETDGPFLTAEAARDALRALRKNKNLSAPVTVEFRAGRYERSAAFVLEAADSGTTEAPVTYQARANEEVRFVGGRSIPAESFSAPIGEAALSRMATASRGQVRVASLKTLGVDPGKFPARFTGFPAVPEIFFNDKRLTLARWPNQEWTTIKSIVDPGTDLAVPASERRGGIFEYADERHDKWSVEEGVWLHGYWCFDWYDETIQVKSLNKETRVVALAEAHNYKIKMGNPSPRRYYAVNLLSELDSPGEYFIDRRDGLLYLWPPEPLDKSKVVVSTVKDAVVAMNNVRSLLFKGFVVEGSVGHGLVANGCEGLRLEGLTVRNVRQLGIQMLGGRSNVVSGCDIYETGEGGINAEGGERTTLTPAGHVVSNNHIHHFAIHKLCYANGIRLGGVGNIATHNLLHDAPHQAVSVSGNNHLFEYNELHDVCMASDDAGAFYKGRNPSMRGNVIRYNFWHHIGSPMGHGNAAIYFDDGDGGESVIGNVFFKCGEPGKGSFGTIFNHGGHDNRSEGNLFVACKRALGSSPWNNKRWENYLKTELLAKMTKEVDITRPPFTIQYPEVVGIMTPEEGAARRNWASNNVLVGCGEVSSGNWEVADNNLEFESDPGFMDPARGDFRFKKTSAVFTQLPGWRNPPVPQMGLVKDAVRTILPPPSFVYDPQDVKSMKAVKAQAAAASRKGPAPVAKIARGSFGDAETISEASLGKPQIVLARDVGGSPTKIQSRAWVRYDDKTLQICVENSVEKGTSFKGNNWGSSEAVEVALRLVGREKTDPIIVFRGFPNGNLQFGQCKNASDEPILSDPNGAVYQASAPSDERWTCRLSIPATLLGWTPAAGQRFAFNITSRKVKSDLWLMWEPTRGHSYDVDQAGIVELTR